MSPVSLIRFSVAILAISVAHCANAAIVMQEQNLVHRDFGAVQVKVPEGYKLEILDAILQKPRMIAFAPNGDMFIGSAFHVYRLKPPYESASEYLSVHGYPHSVAIRDDEIFIATTGNLFKAPYRPNANRITSNDLSLVTRLPGGYGHNSRTVGVGPDGDIYVSLGIAGNCSNQLISDDYSFKNRRGGVMQLDESQTKPRLVPFASGLRNPVGFDWHPVSGVLYASNNGPDHHGFELPPEYFSKLTRGSFHGMPWYQFDGQTLLRDPCIEGKPPLPKQSIILPVATFPSRNAPLGMAFVPTGAMDERFENNAVVALHGSWGTQPDGLFTGSPSSRRPPAVTMVRFENAEATGTELIIAGFQNQDGRRWARPAGIGVGPDGSLYITSDGGDFQGLIRLRRDSGS